MFNHYHYVRRLLQTLAIMAFVSSIVELIVGGLFLCYIVITKSLCILRRASLCFWYHQSFHPIFAFSIHLFLCTKNIAVVFCLIVFSSNLLYQAISITFSFHFLFYHDILIILLVYLISIASSLLARYFVSVQHSNPFLRMDRM